MADIVVRYSRRGSVLQDGRVDVAFHVHRPAARWMAIPWNRWGAVHPATDGVRWPGGGRGMQGGWRCSRPRRTVRGDRL